MKFFYGNIFLIVVLFSGCAQKEFTTNRYFNGYTKDDILNAGKLAFSDIPNSDYIVDSYRNKLEVTKIELFYNNLTTKEYLLKVDEDNCGSNATLEVTTANSEGKYLKHNGKEEHDSVWNRMDYFLGKKNEVIANGKKLIRGDALNKLFIGYVQNITNKKVIKPSKDLSACVIENEFSFGVIQDKIMEENENK